MKYIKKITTPSNIPSTQVIDSLTSTSKTNALSADAGRVLNNKTTGVVLFNNETGVSGNVTLSETSANFDFIEKFFGQNNNSSGLCSIKVYNPNGKYAQLLYTNIFVSEIQLKVRIYQFNEDILTFISNRNVTLKPATNELWVSNDPLVFQVIGYKTLN